MSSAAIMTGLYSCAGGECSDYCSTCVRLVGSACAPGSCADVCGELSLGVVSSAVNYTMRTDTETTYVCCTVYPAVKSETVGRLAAGRSMIYVGMTPYCCGDLCLSEVA